MPEPKKRPPISVPDLTAERIQALRELLPEAFSEGKIDFEKLRATLGDLVDDPPERYSFSWAGKRDAIRLLQTPTRATLTPCPEESLFNAIPKERGRADTKDTKEKENLGDLGVLRGDGFFST